MTQGASTKLFLKDRRRNAISTWQAATISGIVAFAAGVCAMDVAHERREYAVKQQCAKHGLAGYTGFALQTAKGYQCLMVPDKAQPWSFSPSILINHEGE